MRSYARDLELALALTRDAANHGKRLGKGGAKRHRKFKAARHTTHGTTAQIIRRLARRGGVRRISGVAYEARKLAMAYVITTSE